MKPKKSIWRSVFRWSTVIVLLLVLGVHLSYRSEAIRVQSIKMVNHLLTESDLPLVCAGDYNSVPRGMPGSLTDGSAENAITWLAAHHDFVISVDPTSRKPEPTFPSTDPKLPIDWIAIPGQWKFAAPRSPITCLCLQPLGERQMRIYHW